MTTLPFRFPSLARNLRSRRQKMERSIDWVARKAEISKTYLWELEKDEEGEKSVSAAILWKLASVFGCTMEQLLGAADGVPNELFDMRREREKQYGSPRA